MTNEEILKAVDNLVVLARAAKEAQIHADTCGHNQDYIRMHHANESYSLARREFEKSLKVDK